MSWQFSRLIIHLKPCFKMIHDPWKNFFPAVSLQILTTINSDQFMKKLYFLTGFIFEQTESKKWQNNYYRSISVQINSRINYVQKYEYFQNLQKNFFGLRWCKDKTCKKFIVLSNSFSGSSWCWNCPKITMKKNSCFAPILDRCQFLHAAISDDNKQ